MMAQMPREMAIFFWNNFLIFVFLPKGDGGSDDDGDGGGVGGAGGVGMDGLDVEQLKKIREAVMGGADGMGASWKVARRRRRRERKQWEVGKGQLI